MKDLSGKLSLRDKKKAIFDKFETKIRVYGNADVDMEDELNTLKKELEYAIKQAVKELKEYCKSRKKLGRVMMLRKIDKIFEEGLTNGN